MALRLDRLRGPGPKALRDAGPPDWQVIAAVLGGGVIDVLIALVAWRELPLVAYVIPPFVLTLAVALRDHAGLTIRGAIAWVGLEQRRRWTGQMPVSKAAAERWLAAPPADATAFDRASALLTAGRPVEADAALAGFQPETPLDRMRLLRMRASAAAATDPSAELDLPAIRAAAAELPPDEARYHVVSAAWTRAWLDISRKRPWRARFAPVAAEFAPYALPRAAQVVIGVQRFAGPIACVLAGAIVLTVQAVL